MAYSGRFSPKNPKKYSGDPTNIWYRSLWERRVMTHLDDDPMVLEWSSEEIIVPYISPVDNKRHRYFPDFWFRTPNECVMIEVKPFKQSVEPTKRSKVTKAYLNEVMTWGVNQAKWNAAEAYCKSRGWQFRVMTENEIFGRKK